MSDLDLRRLERLEEEGDEQAHQQAENMRRRLGLATDESLRAALFVLKQAIRSDPPLFCDKIISRMTDALIATGVDPDQIESVLRDIYARLDSEPTNPQLPPT